MSINPQVIGAVSQCGEGLLSMRKILSSNPLQLGMVMYAYKCQGGEDRSVPGVAYNPNIRKVETEIRNPRSSLATQ